MRIISGDGSRLVNMRGGRDNLDSAVRSTSVGGNMPNIGPCFYCNEPHGQFECPLLRRMKAHRRWEHWLPAAGCTCTGPKAFFSYTNSVSTSELANLKGLTKKLWHAPQTHDEMPWRNA